MANDPFEYVTLPLEIVRDMVAIPRERYEALMAAAKAACFHYWNCDNECNEARMAMAHLAQVCGFTDPASDDDIQAALRAAGIQTGEDRPND